MSWVEYETTRETGKRWGVSLQWVSVLCGQGRVEGAGKVGHIWIVPKSAPKPMDMRVWNGRNKYMKYPRHRQRMKAIDEY